MRLRFSGIPGSVSRRVRELDHRLRVDRRDRSKWVWAWPIGAFVVTLGLCCVAGGVTGQLLGLAPAGLLGGLFLAGFVIACLLDERDGAADDRDDDSDDGGRHYLDQPPPKPVPTRGIVDVYCPETTEDAEARVPLEAVVRY